VLEETDIGKGKFETAVAFAGGLQWRDIDVVAQADSEGIGFKFDDWDDGITPTDIRTKVEDVVRIFRILPQLVGYHDAADRFIGRTLLGIIGLDRKSQVVADNGMDAAGEDDLWLQLDSRVLVEGVPWPVEVVIGGAEVERIFVIGAKGGIEADAQCTVDVVDIRVKDSFAGGKGRIVGDAVILVVGGHFGKVEGLLYDATHKSDRQIHTLLVAKRFMVVEGGHGFGGRQGGRSGFVVEDLHAGGQVVVAFSDGPFVLTAQGAGPVGVIETVPLVPKDGLDTVVAGEDACQCGVAEQGRFVELGEMDILCPDGGTRQEKGPGEHEQRQERFQRMGIIKFI